MNYTRNMQNSHYTSIQCNECIVDILPWDWEVVCLRRGILSHLIWWQNKIVDSVYVLPFLFVSHFTDFEVLKWALWHTLGNISLCLSLLNPNVPPARGLLWGRADGPGRRRPWLPQLLVLCNQNVKGVQSILSGAEWSVCACMFVCVYLAWIHVFQQ